MSVRAILNTAGDKAYRVLKFDYEFSQPVDSNCVPAGIPRGGFINITVESPRHTGLIMWMLDPDLASDGRITIQGRDSATLRLISYRNGQCIYYREEYDAFNDQPMKIHFRIACQQIEIDDARHQQVTWAEGGGSSSSSSSSGSGFSTGVSSFNPND